MSDSNRREDLEAKHERNRQQRISSIKRWVEFIKTHDADEWVTNRTASSTHNSNLLVSPTSTSNIADA